MDCRYLQVPELEGCFLVSMISLIETGAYK